MKTYRIKADYNSLRETPREDKPREKLARLGVSALTDKELLMLIIGSGTSAWPVDGIAENLLNLLDSGQYSNESIMNIPGLGTAKASAISASIELGRRKVSPKSRAVVSPKDIFNEVRHYASREKEHLIVVMLNGAQECIGTFIATIGLVNRTIVHPREVFADAIASRATAVAIAHNHPSGNTEPSEEDKEVTRRLKQSGDILGIKLLDHLVFTDTSYYSFVEHGLL